MAQLSNQLNVVVTTLADQSVLNQIRAVAPNRLKVATIPFDPTVEGPVTGPDVDWYQPKTGEEPPLKYSAEERTALLQGADVILSGIRVTKELDLKDAPNLKWAHFPFAAVSNLRGTPFWNGSVPLSTSRGYNNALPIAEMIMAGAFALAKHVDIAIKHTVAGDIRMGNHPKSVQIAGKTMGIIGLGGIGRNVARLAKGMGMRVVATRRTAEKHECDAQGVDELFPTAQQNEMLGQCDFVCICALWTDATERMVNRASFNSMKDGVFFLNTGRGEIIEEQALIDALHSGKVAGAYLDVWENSFREPPVPELLNADNVFFTPHTSGRSDVVNAFGLDLFCENLGYLLKGEPMVNIIDWERGY
jgi:phosphoglycerate dehydrogenase-like enzyme